MMNALFLWLGVTHKKTNTSSERMFKTVTQLYISRCLSKREEEEEQRVAAQQMSFLLCVKTRQVLCYLSDFAGNVDQLVPVY